MQSLTDCAPLPAHEAARPLGVECSAGTAADRLEDRIPIALDLGIFKQAAQRFLYKGQWDQGRNWKHWNLIINGL